MKAEETSREWWASDNLVKRAVETGPFALLITDPAGKIVFGNREAQKILGRESDLVGLSIDAILLFDSGLPFRIESIVENSQADGLSLPLLLIRYDRQPLPVTCTISCVKDDSGQRLAWAFSLQSADRPDSGNNLAEELLHQNFYQLFYATPRPVAFIDSEGNVLKVNSAACQLAGMAESQLVGRNVCEFLPPDYQDKFRQDIKNYREGLASDLDIYEMVSPDGTIRKIKIKAERLGNDFFVGFIIDVSEIYELEQSAATGKSYLENFFALASEGFFIAELNPPWPAEMLSALEPEKYLEVAAQSIIVNVNEALSWQYKATPDEIIGKPLLDFIKHNPENLTLVVNTLFKTGKAQYQFELFRSTGERFLAEGSLALVRDDGNVTQIIGVQRDNSEWQRLRFQLAESEERLQLAHQVARLGTWDMDLDTGYITRNETWSTMLGYAPDELQASHQEFLSLLHSEDRPRVEGLIEAILKNPENFVEFESEFRLRAKKGTYKWIRSRARIIKDESGKPVRVIGVNFDVDDYHRTIELLRQSEITYRGLIDSVSDAVYIQDESGAFIDVNQSAERMNGYSKQEIIGKTPEFLSAEGKNDMHAVSVALEKALEGEPQRFEFWGRRADGSIFPKEVTLGPGTYYGLPCVIAVARDISFQKAREEELRQVVKSLEEANAEKDKFFGLIAHDLKSPLSAILGITELLAEDADKLTLGEIQRLSRSLQISAANVYGLLENLLEWSRIRRRMVDFRPEYLPLRQVVSRVMDTHAMAAAKKQVGLLNALNDSVKVIADERLVETVLRNLISNAIKFTGRGGFIKVAAYPRNDGYVVVEVKDTGIGIPENLMNQLFSIAGNAQRKGTEGEPSTGLGLPLCKELVEIQGGTIWAENNHTRGSRFCFTLPKDEDHLKKKQE